MFCKYCGKELADDAIACVGCGRPTDNYKRASAARKEQAAQPVLVQPAQPQPVAVCVPVEKRINSLGIVGFILSLIGIWLGALFCIVPAAGLIISAVGIKKSKVCNSCNGLAIAGLVLGICAIAIWCLFWTSMFLSCAFGY